MRASSTRPAVRGRLRVHLLTIAAIRVSYRTASGAQPVRVQRVVRPNLVRRANAGVYHGCCQRGARKHCSRVPRSRPPFTAGRNADYQLPGGEGAPVWTVSARIWHRYPKPCQAGAASAPWALGARHLVGSQLFLLLAITVADLGLTKYLQHTRYSAALCSSEPAPNRGSSRSDCLHRDGYGRANFNLLRTRIIIGA
jgi:hypothetical protein